MAVCRPWGEVVLILEAYEDGGAIVCGIRHCIGRIALRPKAWLRHVRAELRLLEDIAREKGATEMRVAGRDWSRVFPDYEPMPGITNRLRKRL